MHVNREFLNLIATIGWEFYGYDGNGHIRVHHKELDLYSSIPLSASDYRSHRNALANLERLCGRKVARSKSGKYRHRRVTQFDGRKSAREKEASQHVDSLLREVDELRGQWSLLTAKPTYENAQRARKVAEKYTAIRTELESCHRIVPPLSA